MILLFSCNIEHYTYIVHFCIIVMSNDIANVDYVEGWVMITVVIETFHVLHFIVCIAGCLCLRTEWCQEAYCVSHVRRVASRPAFVSINVSDTVHDCFMKLDRQIHLQGFYNVRCVVGRCRFDLQFTLH